MAYSRASKGQMNVHNWYKVCRGIMRVFGVDNEASNGCCAAAFFSFFGKLFGLIWSCNPRFHLAFFFYLHSITYLLW